jgi:hypothetical protein
MPPSEFKILWIHTIQIIANINETTLWNTYTIMIIGNYISMPITNGMVKIKKEQQMCSFFVGFSTL